MSKLILLNGGVSVGKSTITQRYLDEHALVLGVDRDALMGMLRQWLTHEDEAQAMVFAFSQQLAQMHLERGHDVVLPYLLTDAKHAEVFESIAHSCNASFYEILLYAEKDDVVQRALRRGSWGEPGSPPLTEVDQPIVEDLYDKMMHAVMKRPRTVQIPSVYGAVDATYQQFLATIS